MHSPTRESDKGAIPGYRDRIRPLTAAAPGVRFTFEESLDLAELGVRPGDRVAGFLPNRPEAVIAMLATASIGATWSSCSPDFGVSGVIDRFGQIGPKILFATDGYFYNGKTLDSLERVAEFTRSLETVQQVVIVPFTRQRPELGGLGKAVLWEDFLSGETELAFEALPFDHPLYILYSSGTTGVRKCIVHGAGGTLLQRLLVKRDGLLHLGGFDVALALDLQPAPLGLVDGELHGSGHIVSVEDSRAVHVPGCPADSLDERSAGSQESLLVRIAHRHQGYLRQVQTLSEQIDADQHIELTQPEAANYLHPFDRADI